MLLRKLQYLIPCILPDTIFLHLNSGRKTATVTASLPKRKQTGFVRPGSNTLNTKEDVGADEDEHNNAATEAAQSAGKQVQ
jgi:hypothetical protein